MKIRKKVRGLYLINGLKKHGYEDMPQTPDGRGRLHEDNESRINEYYEYIEEYNKENDPEFVKGEKPKLEN